MYPAPSSKDLLSSYIVDHRSAGLTINRQNPLYYLKRWSQYSFNLNHKRNSCFLLITCGYGAFKIMLMNLLSAFEPRQEWFHYHPAVNSNIIKFKFNIIKIYCHSCHDMRKCFICWQLDPIFSQWLLLLSQCQKNELLKSSSQKKTEYGNEHCTIKIIKRSKIKLHCRLKYSYLSYFIPLNFNNAEFARVHLPASSLQAKYFFNYNWMDIVTKYCKMQSMQKLGQKQSRWKLV